LYPDKNIYDYPGIPEILARDLADTMTTHAQKLGAVIQTDAPVKAVRRMNDHFVLETSIGPFETKSVLLAIGIGLFQPMKLGIPGEDADGIYYKFPQSQEFEGKRVLCVGGGDTAIEAAKMALSNHAAKVYLVHRRNEFRAVEKSLYELQKQGCIFLTPFELTEILQNGKEVRLVNKDTNEVQNLSVDLICIHVGLISDASLIETWGLTSSQHAVIVDENYQTSEPGIFACGDIIIPQGEYKRITIAQGQAAQAVHGVYKYLKSPYWTKTE
ncbi:MAG TPA: NAD(P)/FAD-dependent oxidoreductase, partial [Patescibacteria group bacterium]|nr:NAD(P)/FAD-dependent oxidoreductase [Patescibacteria group bacterium]